MKHTAEVVRVSEGGVIYAKNLHTGNLAVITFGKLRGYCGQTARELKIKRGTLLDINYSENSEVSFVEIHVVIDGAKS